MKAVWTIRAAACVVAAILAMACDDGTSFVSYTGTLEVVTSTTGDAVDDDGYDVLLNEEETAAIGVNDTVAVTLDVGDYAVGLAGLGDPCVVGGDNPAEVTLSQDETLVVAFDIVCQSS